MDRVLCALVYIISALSRFCDGQENGSQATGSKSFWSATTAPETQAPM